MKHTARQHFLHVVLPAHEKFVSYYSGREMGLRRDTNNATGYANALRDLADHVFHDIDDPACKVGYKNAREYRESFWVDQLDYRIICNVADAWKHRSLSRRDRLLDSIDDILEYHILVRYSDENGFYYGSRKMLIVRLSDERVCDLGVMLANSLLMWSNELVLRKLIPKPPEFSDLPSLYRSRAAIEKQPPMRWVAYAEEHFEMHQGTFVYDETSDLLRPVTRGDQFDARCTIQFEAKRSPVEH